MTEPSGSEHSGVVEVSVHGDKYSAESGEPFTFKVDYVVLLIGAGLHYGHFQLVGWLFTVTITIWGGLLPPSIEASNGPNAQPHTNQKVTEIS